MTDPTGPGPRTTPRRTDTDDPRRAREQAVKILFQADVRNVSGEDVLAKLVDDPHARAILDDTEGLIPEPTSVDGFARSLVLGVVRDRDEVDRLISRFARRWQISRMPVVDRTVLRLATYELLHEPTPAAVVIDEAITLVKDLSTEDSGRYVNGVLDAIRRELANRPATPQRTVAEVGDQVGDRLRAGDPLDERTESDPVPIEPSSSEPALTEAAAGDRDPNEPSSSQPTPTEVGPGESSAAEDAGAGATDDGRDAPAAADADDRADAAPGHDADAASAAATSTGRANTDATSTGPASTDAPSTGPADTGPASAGAPSTDSANTDAPSTGPADTDAPSTDAANTGVADGVADGSDPDPASHPETLFDPDIFAAPGASSDPATSSDLGASSDPAASSDPDAPSDPGASSDPEASSDPANPSEAGASDDDPADER